MIDIIFDSEKSWTTGSAVDLALTASEEMTKIGKRRRADKRSAIRHLARDGAEMADGMAIVRQ